MKIKNWIPVFKTGEWTAKNGIVFKADESAIDKIIDSTKNYSSQYIPFTELHPENNLPIWGYFDKNDIRKTRIGKDYVIEVKPKEFAKEFESEMLNKNRKEVSIRILPNMSIAHVGFVPKGAVKGLPSPFAEFAEYDSNSSNEGIDLTLKTKEFVDTNWKFHILGLFLSKFRDKIVEKEGVEVADELITQSDIRNIIEPDEESQTTIKQFGEVEMIEEKKIEAMRLEFEQSIQAKDAEIAKAKAELKAIKDELLNNSCLEFESRVAKKIAPKYRGLMSAVMKALKTQEAQTIFEFSESDEKKLLADVFAEFIESLDDILPDGKRVIAEQPVAKSKIAAQDAAIKEYQESNGCSFGDALKAVAKLKPELF